MGHIDNPDLWQRRIQRPVEQGRIGTSYAIIRSQSHKGHGYKGEKPTFALTCIPASFQ
jgi:hypothetical protein